MARGAGLAGAGNTHGQIPRMLGPDHSRALQLWPRPLAARRPLCQGAKTTTQAAQSLGITGHAARIPPPTPPAHCRCPEGWLPKCQLATLLSPLPSFSSCFSSTSFLISLLLSLFLSLLLEAPPTLEFSNMGTLEEGPWVYGHCLLSAHYLIK